MARVIPSTGGVPVQGRLSQMLSWSGWGILVALAWGPMAVTTYNATKHMVDAPVQMVAWVLLVSLVTSTAIWGIHRLIHKMTARTLIDQRTGVAFTVDGTGSFFFVPMRFWVYLVPVINLALVWAYWG